MSVLVTGASGFLGTRLVDRLIATGQQVYCVSRRPMPDAYYGKANVQWLETDLAEEKLNLGHLTDLHTVFHLAGAKEIPAGNDERLLLRDNELATLTLLQACSRLEVRFIHASTQMVYGDVDSVCVSEDFPLRGAESSPYAVSKLNAENWVRNAYKRCPGHCIVLRLSGFIEGGGNIDYLIGRALRNESMELYSQGTVYRDYLPANKGVDAFISAAEYRGGRRFEVFNIGSGQAVNALELANLIRSELDSRSEVVLLDRPAPKGNFVFDIRKAVRFLAFEPGDLREAVRNYARQKRHSLSGGEHA